MLMAVYIYIHLNGFPMALTINTLLMLGFDPLTSHTTVFYVTPRPMPSAKSVQSDSNEYKQSCHHKKCYKQSQHMYYVEN